MLFRSPSTTATVPVTKLEASLMRYWMVPQSSSARPIDPPYLSTEVGVYKCRWRLSDYLDVLTLLSSTSYFYFTSNKSSIIELCEWISEAKVNANPFLNAVRKEMGAQLNYNSRYTDIMIYRR